MSEAEIQQLRQENRQLHKQMSDMSEDVDKMLRKQRQPHRKSVIAKVQESLPLELRHAYAKNDALRQERLRLWAEIAHNDTALKIHDTKNQVVHVANQINALKEEIRSLKNVQKSQQPLVDVAKHAEQELRYLVDESKVENVDFKTKYAAIADAVKKDEKHVAAMQLKLCVINDKVKFGVDAARLREMQERVDSQGAAIEQLKGQVDSLQVESQGTRNKRTKEQVSVEHLKKKLAKKIERLQGTLRERERELKLSYNLRK